jgi:hypothetical protein
VPVSTAVTGLRNWRRHRFGHIRNEIAERIWDDRVGAEVHQERDATLPKQGRRIVLQLRLAVTESRGM